MASARTARWHVILSGYDFEISHKEGHNHGNADGLSRLPLQENTEVAWLFDSVLPSPNGERIHALIDLEQRPIDATEIKKLTNKGPVLSRVKQYILQGWPSERNLGGDFSSFSQKKRRTEFGRRYSLMGS